MRRQILLAGCYRGRPTQANLRARGRANVRSHGAAAAGGSRRGVRRRSTTGARNFQWALSPLLGGRPE